MGVRFFAATNKDLEAAIRAGAFREDLCYRLAVVPIALLAAAFLREFCARYARGDNYCISRSRRFQTLREYAWPGNVRELRNLVERVVGTVRAARPPPRPPAVDHPQG